MKRLILLTVAIITVGLVPVWVNFGNPVREIDFIGQQIPFILETKRMLASGAPWWSWNTFSGDNFIGGYSFYTVTSPFVWLCCLFSVKNVLWGILLAFYLKTICTSVFAFWYFKKMQLPKQLCILGGLLYAFSSFYIANLFYYHFCEPIMLFPVLLIALEKVINREQQCYFYLALATFAVVFINFYFAFGTLLLGFIYFLFRSHAEHKLTFTATFRAIGAVMVGIMLSSVILLPTVMHHIGKSRFHTTDIIAFLGFDPGNFGGTVVYYLQLILRLFILPGITEGDLLGFGEPFCSNEGFIQVFGIFLAILYVCKRRTWLSWLLLLMFIIAISPLNGVFTCYTSRFYTRWLYGLVLFEILASLYLLSENFRITKRMMVVYIVVCSLLVSMKFGIEIAYSYVNHLDNNGYTWSIVLILTVALFIVNTMALVVWYVRGRNVKSGIWLVSICAALNMGEFTYVNLGGNVESNMEYDYCFRNGFAKQYDNMYRSPDNKFQYRIDNVSNTRNFGIYHNMPGIYGFHSSMNVKLQGLREIVNGVRSRVTFTNRDNRESMAALFSVKEVYDMRDSLSELFGPYRDGLDLKERHDDYDIYSFRYYIPFGFTYDNYITKEELMDYYAEHPEADVPWLMLDNLVVEPGDVEHFAPMLAHGLIREGLPLDSLANRRRITTVSEVEGDTRGFRCMADFAADSPVFFSVAADPGFTATVDGKETPIYEVNMGMSAIVVPAGKHAIEFAFLPSGLKAGAAVSVVGLLLLVLMYFFGGGRRVGIGGTRDFR